MRNRRKNLSDKAGVSDSGVRVISDRKAEALFQNWKRTVILEDPGWKSHVTSGSYALPGERLPAAVGKKRA